jgi:Lrp/AsnC family transcriptional regulator for asnA, asnC and gidA
MDEIDLKILNELQEDARRPFKLIAKKIGISGQTVRRRYDKLLKNHIRSQSISVDFTKLGYVGMAHLFFNSEPNSNLNLALEELKETPGVFIVTRSLGAFEGYAVLLFKDFSDLSIKIEKIKTFPNFGEMEVLLSKFPQILIEGGSVPSIINTGK